MIVAAAKVTNSKTKSSVCLDSILTLREKLNKTETTPKSELSLLLLTKSVKDHKGCIKAIGK
jgi:hypothetical protein